jgi:hypothetical protein
MSMTTMKGYVPKEHSMLSGETKVFSRLGYIPSLTGAATSTIDETPDKTSSVTNCSTRSLGTTETMNRLAREGFGMPSTIDPG